MRDFIVCRGDAALGYARRLHWMATAPTELEGITITKRVAQANRPVAGQVSCMLARVDPRGMP